MSNKCQLNYRANLSLTETQDYVYSDIADWSGKLSGVCSDHSCPANSVCREVSGKAACDVIYCDISIANRSVDVYLDAKHDEYFIEGEKVEYRCPTGYFKNDLTCGHNGIWTGEARCVSPPIGCAGVITCNSSAESGLYWIVHDVSNGTAIKIFCDRRDDWMYPLVVLNEEYNYSIFPRCDNLDYCGRTSFQKVRVSFGSYRLGDKDKYDHASHSCGQQYAPFGWAGGCSDIDHCEGDAGNFIINTTGTGFIVDPSLSWTNADVTRQNDNRVVIGRCRENCQLCQPDVKDKFRRLLFVFDPYYQPLESEATVLNCPATNGVA